MPRLSSHRRSVTVVGTILALALAAGAYAYFSSSGAGTGSATIGQSTTLVVTPGTTVGSALLPASGSQSIPYTVTNPTGAGAQRLTTTTATIAADPSGNILTTGRGATTPVPGCLASWFTATNTAPAATTLAEGATATGLVIVRMDDSGTSQDACQGASPDVTIAAS